uniref:Uncharacterized protein n=1 Tax=Geobacter metallireducens TaxID=28232 RepID=A0A831XF38_GEOME
MKKLLIDGHENLPSIPIIPMGPGVRIATSRDNFCTVVATGPAWMNGSARSFTLAGLRGEFVHQVSEL